MDVADTKKTTQCDWLTDFLQEQAWEVEEAKTEIFKRFGSKLETDRASNDYVFFSMNAEMLKGFSQTMQHILKVKKAMQQNRHTFFFTEQGMTSYQFGDSERMGTNQVLSRYFVQDYVMDQGLEIAVTVELDKFSLLHSKRKDACNMVYMIASNAGLATWAVSRNPKKHCPDFYPSVQRQSPEQEQIRNRSLQPVVQFGFLSDQLIQTQNTSATSPTSTSTNTNEKQSSSSSSSSGNTIYLEYILSGTQSQLSLSTSAKALEESKCSIFYPQPFRFRGDEKMEEKALFRGSFPKDILSSFCKLSSMNSPIIFISLVTDPYPVLMLRTYYSELSLPGAEPSFFELCVEDQDTFLQRQDPVPELIL